MNRLALYGFYESHGILRPYVRYYLKGLLQIAQNVLLIANGELTDESKKALDALGVRWMQRENRGLDFCAWKAGLAYVGWDKVRQYDEIILCNCSCYGPVYPFEEMFSAMSDRSCDFWGGDRHPACKDSIPVHLQSYFLVLRKSLIQSEAFKNYWDALVPAATWNDAVAQETQFTRYFEEKGFVSSSYVEQKSFMPYVGNPSVFLPYILLEKYHFPFLKRKVFTEPYKTLFSFSRGNQGCRSIETLQEKTDFPTDIIYDDLLHSMHGSEIRRVMHHTFILSDASREESSGIHNSLALIVFSYFEDLMDECFQGMAAMPENSHIFIVVISERMKELWEDKKESLVPRRVEIRVQKNRGRNESAYWITCRDVIEKYEIICVAHDKKTPSARPGIKGYYFSQHCWNGILKSKEYVHNILDLFSRNPRIGLLMPPPPIFSNWDSCTVGNEWAGNRKWAKELYRRLDLHVPFDEHPDAPYGSMFWVRGKAMTPFYRYSWSIEDFPEEPLRVADGTILHALERMYPMIVQEAGFFSGWIMPSSEAGINYDNLYFSLQQREAVLQGTDGVHFINVKKILMAYGKKVLFKFINKLRV